MTTGRISLKRSQIGGAPSHRAQADATAYNGANKYVPLTTVTDSGGLSLSTSFVFDAVGNLRVVDGPRSDVSDTTAVDYDAERRPLQTTNALGKISRVGYDADGRAVRTARQMGTQWLVSCTRYSPSGKPLRAWGPALTAADTTCPAEAAPAPIVDTAYDDQDRPSRISQSLLPAEGGSRVSDMGYLADGQLAWVKRAVGTALEQTYALTAYNAAGLPETLTDARGYLTRSTWDGHGRRLQTLFPNPAATGQSSATDFEQYGWDANANLVSLRRRSGITIGMGYDSLNRLTSRTYPKAADNTSFSYDLLGRRLSANLADASHAIAYSWDHAGRLSSTTAGGRALSYLYDPAGNRTRTTWPDGFFTSSEYDALNRLTRIRENGAAVLADFSAYDDLSRRTAVSLGNATVSRYGYDAQGGLAKLSHDLAGSAQDVGLSYSRNQAREITGLTNSNALYRWLPTASSTRSSSVNGLNQITNYAGAVLTHDTSGNVSSDGSSTWAYDADNQLRSATSAGLAVTLAYDASGRLRQESVSGSSTATTQLLYDGTDLVAEYDGTGKILRRYVHGPGIDEPLVVYTGSSTASKEWLYADHLGSVIASANPSGASTASYTYGPFGEPDRPTGARFRYTGQTFFPNLGLYYYKARFYSPVIGRFLQTDPIGTADDLNLYQYVGNSPVNRVEPSGLTAAAARMLASGLVGQQGAGGGGNLFSAAVHAPSMPGGAIGGGLGEWLGSVGSRMLGALSLPLSLSGDTTRDDSWERVNRYMSAAEANATVDTGLARGGRDGVTFVTNDYYATASAAQKALALPNMPEVLVLLGVRKGAFSRAIA